MTFSYRYTKLTEDEEAIDAEDQGGDGGGGGFSLGANGDRDGRGGGRGRGGRRGGAGPPVTVAGAYGVYSADGAQRPG